MLGAQLLRNGKAGAALDALRRANELNPDDRPAADTERSFSRPLERYTPNTIVSVEAMRGEIARIRSDGYAVDDEEGVIGLRCIAAPIWDKDGIAIAAMSSSGAAAELTGERRAAAWRGSSARALSESPCRWATGP